ncbi:MAG: M23 family metallopeptidase [Cellulosilyticaceae bacterium]
MHKPNSKFNIFLFFLLIFLWGSVYSLHGIIGAGAWLLLKFVLPIVGCIGLVISTILLIVALIKKKYLFKRMTSFILYAVLTFPIFFLFGVIDFAYPISRQTATPAATVRWPMRGKTIVGWGGDAAKTNLPHAVWASERWAYDLVMEPYEVGSKKLEDYGIWNQEVIAPISGTVVEAYDDEDDITPGTEDFKSMEGNHVYIKNNETNTYLLLNHLKKDSVRVKTGDTVKEGTIIGRVGNSGSTSEPHLHIQHQRQNPTKALLLAEGLPLYFKNINTSEMPEKGVTVIPEK